MDNVSKIGVNENFNRRKIERVTHKERLHMAIRMRGIKFHSVYYESRRLKHQGWMFMLYENSGPQLLGSNIFAALEFVQRGALDFIVEHQKPEEDGCPKKS